MKKFLAILCALVTTLTLAACSSPEGTESGSSGSSVSSSGTSESSANSGESSSDISSAPGGEDSAFISYNLPRMDGSTSATPLEIGLKAGLLGIPYADAKKLVSHTTTHDSFKRLLNRDVDLIFSVPISAEQQKAADDAGVKLTMKPVAREGFVFVVNAQNPVDGLTSEQVRKIYSGEITNWKEVGGNDEPIIPYQRNTDSGSQNYMTVFMGDTPLLKPESEYIAIGMGGLMDAVAVYDNSAGAIGYSVYSYAAQMYENADKVKFIAIDGVKPSKATMADESYPLLSNTYIIYTDKSLESAAKFTDMVLSDKGQNIVLESGYLPVNGMDVPEKYLPYEAVGTGVERPADFKPSDKYSYIWIAVQSEWAPDNLIAKNGKYYELVDFLKNTELQDAINKDIRDAMDRLRGFELPKTEQEYRGSSSDRRIDEMDISVVCRNGYLSILIGYEDSANMWMETVAYHKAETINYDLFSGKKLEHFSDLFYKDEEFLRDVDLQFNESAEMLSYSGKKLDYSGILGKPRVFTIDGVILDPDNLYFDYAPTLYYDDKFNFHSPATEFRDMKPLIADAYADKVEDVSYHNEWETKLLTENGDIYERFVGSPFHSEAEVKAKDALWYDMQKRAWGTLRELYPEYHSEEQVVLFEYENHYAVGHFTVEVGGTSRVNFDKNTLKILTMEDILGKDWRQYIDNPIEEDKTAKFVPSEWWGGNDENTLTVFATSVGQYGRKMLTVPKDKFNERYLESERID